jgi:hypothetical protein
MIGTNGGYGGCGIDLDRVLGVEDVGVGGCRAEPRSL